MVRLQARPEPIDIDLERTAIIVVDMQNSFVAKGGMFDLAGFDIAGSAPVIEANRRLLAASRAAAVKVIYLVIAFKPDLSDAGDPSSPAYHKELALRMMRSRPELAGKLLIDGGWDAAIVEALAPQPGEAVIRKTRYDGFCRTELDAVLRAGNIRYLLFTGVQTGFNEQRSTTAQAHGKLVDLPNHGDISMAVGADYRHEQGGFHIPAST